MSVDARKNDARPSAIIILWLNNDGVGRPEVPDKGEYY